MSNASPTNGYRPWLIVALLVAFSFMSWFNRVSMAVAYDTNFGPGYGVTEEAIGTVYSAFFLSYLLFMTPGGWFADRFGPRLALVIMGVGSGLFGALTCIAALPTWHSIELLVTALLVVRFAMGLVSAPIYPASARMVLSWVSVGRRVFANGLIQGAAAVGMAAAFPVFGAMIDAWDWPVAFLISGIVTVVLGIVWWFYATDRPRQTNPTPVEATKSEPFDRPLPPDGIAELDRIENRVRAGVDNRRPQGAEAGVVDIPSIERPVSWLTLLLNRNVILLTLSYAAVGYLEYLFFFWMNHYFGEILHIEKSRSRIYTAILLLSMAVGMVAGGWIADQLRRSYGQWIGRALVPMVGMTLGAVFLGLGVTSESILWIVVWLALALAAVGATEAPTWTASAEVGGVHGGTASAIVNTGGNLGGFIAPTLTPFVSHAVRDSFGLSDQAGWQWGISLAGALCLSGATLWWWIKPDENTDR